MNAGMEAEEEEEELAAQRRRGERENRGQLRVMVSSQCLASRARGRNTYTSSRSTCADLSPVLPRGPFFRIREDVRVGKILRHSAENLIYEISQLSGATFFVRHRTAELFCIRNNSNRRQADYSVVLRVHVCGCGDLEKNLPARFAFPGGLSVRVLIRHV